MYINRPVVKLSNKEQAPTVKISTTPKQKSRVVTTRQPTVQQKDKKLEAFELDSLEMVYDLEHKVQKVANRISECLEDYNNVEIAADDMEILNRTREEMDSKIQKQMKQELMKLSESQAQKMHLEQLLRDRRQKLRNFQREVNQYRESNKADSKLILQSKEREQTIKDLESKLEQCNKDRANVTRNFRMTQQRLLRQKQQLNLMDSEIFSKDEQIQQCQRNIQKSMDNEKHFKDFTELEQYKFRVIEELERRGREYENQSKEKVEELVNIRVNISKIDGVLKSLMTTIYEQRCYLRAGEQEKTQVDRQSDEQAEDFDQDELQKLEYMKEYESFMIASQDDRWGKYKNKLNSYMSNRKMKNIENGDYTDVNLYDPKRKIRTEDNTIRYTLHSKSKPRPVRSINPESLQLNSLYSMNSDKLKRKIAGHLKSKQVSDRQTRQKLSSNSSVELISVDASENDSKFQYVQVQMSKNELKSMANRKR